MKSFILKHSLFCVSSDFNSFEYSHYLYIQCPIKRAYVSLLTITSTYRNSTVDQRLECQN